VEVNAPQSVEAHERCKARPRTRRSSASRRRWLICLHNASEQCGLETAPERSVPMAGPTSARTRRPARGTHHWRAHGMVGPAGVQDRPSMPVRVSLMLASPPSICGLGQDYRASPAAGTGSLGSMVMAGARRCACSWRLPSPPPAKARSGWARLVAALTPAPFPLTGRGEGEERVRRGRLLLPPSLRDGRGRCVTRMRAVEGGHTPAVCWRI